MLPACARLPTATALGTSARALPRARPLAPLAASKKPAPKAPAPVEDDSDIGTVGLATAVAGLLFNPIVLFSEYTLQTTGAGLPPGPGGLYGAAGEHASGMGALVPCYEGWGMGGLRGLGWVS